MPSVFAAPSAILLRESAYASSIFDFWAGTTWIRMWRAADTAAASAEALGANGAVVTYRVYFGCTEFTASDIATCTIAMERDQGLPTVPAAFSASIVW